MKNQCVRVILSLGANCGDRFAAVGEACDWLLSNLSNGVNSQFYETPPLGQYGSNYVNGVVAGLYCGSRESLEQKCKEYERSKGRDEEARRRKDVPIDIDVVVYDGEVVRPKDYACNFFRIGYEEIKSHF